MEKLSEDNLSRSMLLKKYYKEEYSALFNKIKGIRTPVKNDIITSLLDGKWHSERDLIRMAKKQQYNYLGAVTLGTMVSSINNVVKSNYVEKEFIAGAMHYKISENYIGLTRAAYTKYSFRVY